MRPSELRAFGDREADIVLRDGSTAHVRPVGPGDAEEVRSLFAGLSERSQYLRFFSVSPSLDTVVRWATAVGDDRRFGLVATFGGGDHVVAHAAYAGDDAHPDRAEVALAITDRMQGKGIGTLLLGQLAEAAAQAGVSTFTGEVLPENHQMIKVLRDSGFAVATRTLPGTILVEFPTSLTEEARDRFQRREHIAAVAAVRTVLAPRSVAVIGASRRRETIGGTLFHNLREAGFEGPVFPVNPLAEVVQSVRAYPSVAEIPAPVDLAVVAVPAPLVVQAARQCAAKGVRGLVVVAAGFAEHGPQGAERQRELLAVCRNAGMRLVGPNCLGVVNTAPEVRLHAAVGPMFPARGRVGLLSQSGALGIAMVGHAIAHGLGLSSFVSVGNKADISSNDLLDYWEEDPDTGVILLYLESFGNPRNFARIARRVGRSKPIVAVKSGRLAAGAEAGSSHIGALLAASDQTVDALFRQAGVLRADTLAESFDVARLLVTQPLPPGRRVAVLTNATGPGTVCVDACGAGDLEVPALSDDLEARLAGLLPDGAAIANPVDLPTSAPADAYREAIRCLARSGEVDAVLAIVVPLLATDPAVVLRAVGDAAVNSTIPVLAVVMSSAGAPAAPQAGERLPVYGFPEDAANALAHAARHHAWLTRSAGRVPELDVRRDEAAGLLARALADGPTPRWLNPEEVSRLFDCYGLPMAEGQAGRTAAEAGTAAQTLAGVAELAVGVVHDASFGPVVACSVGGPAAELLRDVAVRITPLTDTDAAEMVRSLAAFPLLHGYGGKPRADVAAAEDLLLRLSALVDTHPEVALLDCHPVVVRPADHGVTIVDARVRIQPAPPTPMVGARQP
jgi:acyl-CoA synthetase (NDP forming)/RimJ/RimL family protein N-acetyltransferase